MQKHPRTCATLPARLVLRGENEGCPKRASHKIGPPYPSRSVITIPPYGLGFRPPRCDCNVLTTFRVRSTFLVYPNIKRRSTIDPRKANKADSASEERNEGRKGKDWAGGRRGRAGALRTLVACGRAVFPAVPRPKAGKQKIPNKGENIEKGSVAPFKASFKCGA